MSISKVSMSLIRRCGTQKMMFHSSSYMRAAKMSNKNVRLLNQGREQLASSSSWRSYLLPIGVLGGIGGGVLFMHFNDEKRATRRGECRNDGRSARNAPVIGGPFQLISADGRLVTEKDLQGGDWILIYFGYTSSPDVGPAELAKLAKAINTLDSERNIKIQPVFVTVDPQRDTPSHLRAYLKEFDERIMGLTGPVRAVRQMANEYRVFFKKVEEDGDDYLVESSHNIFTFLIKAPCSTHMCFAVSHSYQHYNIIHTLFAGVRYLMNPSMEIVRGFGLEYTADQLSQEIQKVVHKTPN